MGDEGDEAGKLITDPHVWNSPKNAEVELRNIANALEAVDPDNKDYYEANYQQVAAECEQLDSDFSQTLSACSKKEIVVSHEAWGYLCDAYGLTEVGIAGLDPEAEPDAQSMHAAPRFPCAPGHLRRSLPSASRQTPPGQSSSGSPPRGCLPRPPASQARDMSRHEKLGQRDYALRDIADDLDADAIVDEKVAVIPEVRVHVARKTDCRSSELA